MLEVYPTFLGNLVEDVLFRFNFQLILLVLFISCHRLFDKVVKAWLYQLHLVFIKKSFHYSLQFQIIKGPNILFRAEKISLKVGNLLRIEVFRRFYEIIAEKFESLMNWYSTFVYREIFSVLLYLASRFFPLGCMRFKFDSLSQPVVFLVSPNVLATQLSRIKFFPFNP